MGGGLNMYERNKKIFIRYNKTNSNINTDYVQSIKETENGDLWLSNTLSIERFDRGTKKFEHFVHDDNDSNSLSSNKVMSVFKDSKGNIWACTDVGLNIYIKKINGFKHYRTEDGLPNNFINSILEDNQGNLWLGTNRGLSKFINAISIPENPKFKNYVYEDGLQSIGFNKRSCLLGTDGMVYFGGANGFNVFDPSKLTENTYIPPIVIADFQIFNKSVPIGDKGLKNDAGISEDIILSYKQSVFSFDFAALNYISSSKNQYAYKMEGFDEDWNYAGTKHTATYTNLDPGKYIFRVKGSNNDGIWNEKGIALPIIITPPYWETIWFRLLLVVGAIGIAFWIYKWRMQARDLAAQKRMEVALTKDRNLLRAVIDNIPDGIYTKDLNYRRTLTNRADVTNMGRKSEAEVLGKDDFEFFPKELAEGFIADDQTVTQTGQPVINREEYIINEQDQKRWLVTSKIPLQDEKGQTIGLVGISRDITDKKKAEEEREQLIKELQEAAADIKVLSGLVPICSNCKKIRDDKGYWTQLEGYIQEHSEAKFSHGVCPECAQKLYGDLYAKVKKQQEAASAKLPPSDSSKG